LAEGADPGEAEHSRQAEAAVRAEILVPLPPLQKKETKATDPMPEDLN
jgi:hypothetical protein